MMPINNTFLGIVMYGGTLVKKKKIEIQFLQNISLAPHDGNPQQKSK